MKIHRSTTPAQTRNLWKFQHKRSNEHQVVITKAMFVISGNFSCEVTVEESFAAMTGYNDMLVVGNDFPSCLWRNHANHRCFSLEISVLPDKPPTLTTDKSFYIVGDLLRANCTSPPSRPAATLSFVMNNIVVSLVFARACCYWGEKCWGSFANEGIVFNEFHFSFRFCGMYRTGLP